MKGVSYRAELKFQWHAGTAFGYFMQVSFREKPADSESNPRVANLVNDHSCPLAEARGEEFLGFKTGGTFRWARGYET
jgi:hypothetical protein